MAIIFNHQTNILHAAGAGDARAICGTVNSTFALTHDHKPDISSEK